MEYVETYAGGERAKDKPGFLVPYFALALFAGIQIVNRMRGTSA
jgi:hypothetical protein